MKKRVAVLGAGPTGLAATWKLAHQDFDVDLFEKESHVGGLGGSVTLGQFTVDYGPHIFHVKKGEVYPLLRSIYDHEITVVPRKTKMILDGKSFTYPFKLGQLITGLNPLLTFRIIISYAKQLYKNKFHPQPLDSFEAWGIYRFGRVLYELCFGHYTEKVWGIPTSQISPVLGQQKVVNKLSLMSFVKNMLGFSKDKEQFTHYQDFVYCMRGSGHFYGELANSVENMGARVYRNATITKLHVENNEIKAITFDHDGVTKTQEYSHVLSSIPLSSLINLIHPEAPAEHIQTANALQYRALIFVYLVINKDYATDAHWIYLLDKKFVFNRITEQKQFSRHGFPEGKTIVCFEICCKKDDALWKANDEKLYEMVLEEVDRLKGKYFTRNDIGKYYVVKKNHVYPLFDLPYDQNVKKILNYVEGIPNLYTTGRNGLFINNDMHANMILGIENAQKIILNIEEHKIKAGA